MSKKEFIEEQKEIIEDPNFIGNSVDGLLSETGENTWDVSLG